MMEGFECKLVSAWPFDPLSNELLLLQKPPPNSEHNKLLAFSTLNLNTSSLSPFDLNLNLSTETDEAVSSSVEDINNNSGLVGVSFLTLDPLVVDQVAPSMSSSTPDSNSRVHILASCFAGPEEQTTSNNKRMSAKLEQTGEERPLPKFEEIHFDNSQNIENPNQNHGGGGDDSNVEVDDVDGIYFSIQDLDQYDRDGKGYLIEDLMGVCNPNSDDVNNSDFLQPPPTLDVDLLVDDDEEDEDQGQTSNSNSFDLEIDLEDKDDYPMDMDIEELHKPLEGEDGEKQELKCKFCGFICCSKSSLGIHERRHTGERPYACKYCGRLFNSAQCCKHHERLHTGDKPFECQYCGKKYAVSTRLKRHERVHTREEPYKCGEPGCGKTFRWFDAFRDHRNTHNGVPLYLCSVCGKNFTSYLKFYYHERGHFLKRERDRDRDRAKKLQQQQLGATVPATVTPPMKKPKKSKVAAKSRG